MLISTGFCHCLAEAALGSYRRCWGEATIGLNRFGRVYVFAGILIGLQWSLMKVRPREPLSFELSVELKRGTTESRWRFPSVTKFWLRCLWDVHLNEDMLSSGSFGIFHLLFVNDSCEDSWRILHYILQLLLIQYFLLPPIHFEDYELLQRRRNPKDEASRPSCL